LESKRKPEWLKIKRREEEDFFKIRRILKEKSINTVCEEANCPNIYECWNSKSATFLILGDICTRKCKFCSVKKGTPAPPSPNEPERIAEAVLNLGLTYAVITSVTRDDLDDGGASVFAETVLSIKRISPKTKVEVLIPDFKGRKDSFIILANSKPDVVSHNIEVPRRLYKKIGRNEEQYYTSLNLLTWFSNRGFLTKSGIMVGLGEEPEDILEAFYDISSTGCDILTIGQYLTPSANFLPVERFYTPEEFEKLKRIGMRFGFKNIHSGPLVRSSYKAEVLV
jgi:lipoic acid synthetase